MVNKLPTILGETIHTCEMDIYIPCNGSPECHWNVTYYKEGMRGGFWSDICRKHIGLIKFKLTRIVCIKNFHNT